MEPKKTEAIILRTRDFGESDCIVTVFSSLCGTLKGLAKGARRSSKRFVNSLNIFSHVNLEFRDRRSGDLVWLDSCELIDGFPGIRADYALLLRASYVAELTETLFPINVPSNEMFQLLGWALGAISDGRDLEKTMIVFQARAVSIGGFSINTSKCGLCGRAYKGEGRALFHPSSGSIVCMACEKESALTPGIGPNAVHVLTQLQSHDLPALDSLDCDQEMLTELSTVLAAHIEHHIGKRLRSAQYLT
ncbi:MAG: DNA repair protein RecO [Deltaproteobacteria bacterium]|nr:DNA repair protein RecO [Deltaproteobacteria bacterium]